MSGEYWNNNTKSHNNTELQSLWNVEQWETQLYID